MWGLLTLVVTFVSLVWIGASCLRPKRRKQSKGRVPTLTKASRRSHMLVTHPVGDTTSPRRITIRARVIEVASGPPMNNAHATYTNLYLGDSPIPIFDQNLYLGKGHQRGTFILTQGDAVIRTHLVSGDKRHVIPVDYYFNLSWWFPHGIPDTVEFDLRFTHIGGDLIRIPTVPPLYEWQAHPKFAGAGS